MFQYVALLAMSQLASAAAIEARDAAITPAPLAKRVVTTAGYRSTGFSGGSTLWGTVTYNLEDAIMATSSDLFRICKTASACDFFICSGNYAVYPASSSSSTYCGSSSSLTCSYDVSYTDLQDPSPLTNFWCDSATLDGWNIYAATTSDGDSSKPTPTPGPITSPTNPTPSPGPTSPIVTPTPTPTPAPSPPKSTPIGAIVGGVVGGLVVIGLIIVAVVFVLRKKKQNANANPAAPAYQQPPPPPQGGYAQPAYYPPPQQQMPQQQSPQMGYNPHASMVGPFPPAEHEKTPSTQVTANPYYVNSDSGPTSPVPQYTPHNGAVNELPVGRM